MKLKLAEFTFSDPDYEVLRVVFVGRHCRIYRPDELLAEVDNPWTGRSKQNNGIENREFKPRAADVKRLIANFKAGRKPDGKKKRTDTAKRVRRNQRRQPARS